VDGFLQAAGMCGQGFMLGPGVAELLSRIVSGKPEPADEEILSYLSPYRSFVSEEKLK
jgi:sarcosine oxidase subunit beta